MGNRYPHEEVSFELPPIEEADEAEGFDEEDDDDMLLGDDDDPFDDACADDLPLDIVLSTTNEEGSAVGDERLGIEEGGPEDVLAFDEGSDSLLDDGKPDNSLGVESDDELGLDALPGDLDDGGLEGMEDAAGERVDENAFPPLDGDVDDNEDLDVGVHIEENLID
ncbi:MAG TPA: hypothetical protein VFB62_00615 [Polyangiaceae bacterium]|jgi:hypothetical protein|nr:hypothetical protein [Polyangiaceae bacterium]